MTLKICLHRKTVRLYISPLRAGKEIKKCINNIYVMRGNYVHVLFLQQQTLLIMTYVKGRCLYLKEHICGELQKLSYKLIVIVVMIKTTKYNSKKVIKKYLGIQILFFLAQMTEC